MRLFFVALFALQAAAAGDPSEPVFRVGVCTHFSQGKGQLPANLDLIRAAGIDAIRDEVTWRALEREKGRLSMPAEYTEYVEKAVERGLEPMLILDYGNPFYDGGDKPLSPEAVEGFAKYSEFVVRHFKGKVRHYEIWNEWDIGIGRTTPGTAESYANLLKHVYQRIKEIEPGAVVYGGAMTSGAVRNGWLERMLKAGALKSLDVLSIHTYNYSASGRERGPEAWAQWMDETNALVQKYSSGAAVPIVVTEMGWPTQIDRRGSPPELAAAYLARMYLLARTMPFLKGIWWYDFQDDGWKATYNEDNFGMVRPDLTPKPAYFALSTVSDLVRGSTYQGRINTSDPEVYVLKFRRSGGADVWAVWSAHADDDYQITIQAGRGGAKPVTVQQVGAGSFERTWDARAWAEDRGAAPESNKLRITVRGMPWLISGDLTGATVTEVIRRESPQLSRGSQFLQ